MPTAADVGALMERALSGRPAGILLTGEAGIGKTRLFRHVTAAAIADGWLGLVAEAEWSRRTIPYGALVDALQCAELRGDSAAEAARDHLSSVLDLRARQVSADVHGVAGRILDTLRAQGPVLLAIDDIDLADDDTIATLTSLLRRPAPMPLLVLGSARHNRERGTALLGALLDGIDRAGGLVTVELAHLSKEDVAVLIADEVGCPPTDDLILAVFDRSGGNPFVALQAVRALDEAGALVLDDEAAMRPDPITLSAGRREILLHRVVHASEDVRIVARVASLVTLSSIDRVELVADLVGVPADRAARAFDALVRRGVLVDRSGSYRFAHDLVREALAEEVGPAERRRIHRAAADRLGALAMPGPDDVLERARHLVEVARVGDLDAAAALAAAAELTAIVAPRTAVHWYRQAIGLLPASAADAAHLRARLARSLFLASRPREAVEVGRQALDDLPPGSERTRTTAFVIECLIALCDIDGAVELLDRETSGTVPPLRLIGIAAHLYAVQGRKAEVDRVLVVAAEMLPVAPAAERVTASVHLAHALAILSRPEEMIALFEALEHDADRWGIDLRLAMHINRAHSFGSRGDTRRTAASIDVGTAIAADVDIMRHRLQGVTLLHDFNRGAWDEFLAGADALRPELEAMDDYIELSFLDRTHLAVLTHRGEWAAARRLAASQRPLHPVYRDFRAWAIGVLDAMTGNVAPGIAALERAIALAHNEFTGEFMRAALVALHLGAGDRVAAQQTVREMATIKDGWMPPLVIEHLLARAMATDDVGAARGALEVADEHALAFYAGWSQLALGELMVDVDRNLPAAHERFHALGADPWRRRTASAMRASGLKVPRHRSGGRPLLSTTELEVARLVQAGRRTREIATVLSLSPKTVEVYLSRIYGKIGCGSRLELARAMDAGLLDEQLSPAQPESRR